MISEVEYFESCNILYKTGLGVTRGHEMWPKPREKLPDIRKLNKEEGKGKGSMGQVLLSLVLFSYFHDFLPVPVWVISPSPYSTQVRYHLLESFLLTLCPIWIITPRFESSPPYRPDSPLEGTLVSRISILTRHVFLRGRTLSSTENYFSLDLMSRGPSRNVPQ